MFKRIFSFLVPVGKNIKEDIDIYGSEVPLEGNLYLTLNEKIVKNINKECDIPISFIPENGKQKNEVRNILVEFLKTEAIDVGKLLAKRLCGFTSKISGNGLLFLIITNENKYKNLIISRFPVESGLSTNIEKSKLNIEYLENIFMKNSNYYKATIYSGESYDSDFWEGLAVDKQINRKKRELADYWIKDFLKSQFRITSKTGTSFLATSLKESITKCKDVNSKNKLLSVAILAENLNGKAISVNSFCNKYSLPDNLKDIITKSLPTPEIAEIKFEFNLDEFKSILAYTTIYLDNEAVLSAPSFAFHDVWEMENDQNDKVRFSTYGQIVNEKIKSRI